MEQSYDTFTSSLATDDDEFIRVAEIIIRRLKKVKRERFPSWFERNFKDTRIGRRRRKRREEREARTDYGFLSSDDLIDFQHALFLRLEADDRDNTLSVFVDAIDICPIPHYMNSVLSLVEFVGWPKPDDLEVIFSTNNDDAIEKEGDEDLSSQLEDDHNQDHAVLTPS